MSSSYETIGELGEGACGKVYLCRQRDTNQMLAQKEIKLAALKTNEISKLLEEVRVLEKFREFPHRNLVEGKGYLQTTNTLYIYMEYCERGSLAADIESRQGIGFYDEKTILDYTHQIASGLNHMHQLLVLHRDLKPANILITFDGVFKLADFGLGALLSSESSMRASVVGTPLYVAPEIIKEENYNLSCDIWAFGTILYELMALKPAFKARHPAAVINKILNGNFNPLEGSYSEPLKRLVTLMLMLDPNMRPDSSSIVALQFLSNRKIDSSSMRELDTLISKNAKGKERKEVKDKQREAEEKQRLEEKEDHARLRIKAAEWRRRKEEYDEMDEKLKQINKLTESELVEHVRGLDEERKRRDVVERQRKEEEQKRPDSVATKLDAAKRALQKIKLETYEKNTPGWTDGDRLKKASNEENDHFNCRG